MIDKTTEAIVNLGVVMILRLNHQISAFAVVFVGLALLVSIRFSSYILPSQYYFSISSVFKSDESLMLVEHPGVTGKRFCEIVRKYKVTVADLNIQQFDCSIDRAPEENNIRQYKLKANHYDKVYDTWIDAREKIATKIETSIDRRALAIEIFEQLSMVEVHEREKIMFAGSFIELLESAIFDATKSTIGEHIIPHFQQLFDEIAAEYSEPADTGNQLGNVTIVSDEQFERLRLRLAAEVSTKIASTLALNQPIDIGFTKMQKSVESATHYWEVETAIVKAYIEELVGSYRDVVDQLLASENLRAANVKKALDAVQTEFILENLPTYIISAVIRFFIVLLTVFIVAFATFQRFEIQNYAFGAAFAALLLTWPVISLWDWVVREEWQALKLMFLAIYLLYMIAFYFTGKAAAHLAFLARNRLALAGYGKSIEAATDGSQVLFEASLKEMTNSLVIAVTSSVFVYALNLLVPVNV